MLTRVRSPWLSTSGQPQDSGRRFQPCRTFQRMALSTWSGRRRGKAKRKRDARRRDRATLLHHAFSDTPPLRRTRYIIDRSPHRRIVADAHSLARAAHRPSTGLGVGRCASKLYMLRRYMLSPPLVLHLDIPILPRRSQLRPSRHLVGLTTAHRLIHQQPCEGECWSRIISAESGLFGPASRRYPGPSPQLESPRVCL